MIETIQNVWNASESIIAALGAIVIAASMVTAGTKTPAEDSFLGKVYKWIERAALVVGKAKNKPEDE